VKCPIHPTSRANLLPAAGGEGRPERPRLHGQNDRNLLGAWGPRFKIVATPSESGARYALYDRKNDPGETHDVTRDESERAREERRELELFRERTDAQLVKTRRLLEGSPEEQLTPVRAKN
jgi:hypothetical protein